jgi:hypothetical protein
MADLDALKQELSANSPWLTVVPLVDDLSKELDQKISDVDKEISPGSKLPYDELRYESLLADASSLIDRCLAYRREYSDLVAQALRQALEYDLFSKQRGALKDLEIAEWLRTQKKSEVEGQRVVQQVFANSEGVLEKGFAASAKLAADIAQGFVNQEDESGARRAAISNKWTALEYYQRTLNDLHQADGQAMNYGQRANRIKALLVEDFTQAYRKAKIAAGGLDKIMDVNIALTRTVHAMAPLDDVTMWLRQLIEAYDRKTSHDSEYLLLFRFSKNLPSEGRPELDLSDADDPRPLSAVRVERPRARAVGAQVMFKSENSPRLFEHARLILRINPRDRQPFLLPNVSVNPPSSRDLYTGPGIFDVIVGAGWTWEWLSSDHAISSILSAENGFRNSVYQVTLCFTCVASR